MNEYIKRDADKMINFLQTYSLEGVLKKESFIEEYRMIHKKSLCYLIIFSEIERQNIQDKLFGEKPLFYLKESVSDVLQSVFVWSNGAYKGADLLLRSSIENFNKAIIGNFDDTVYGQKSVYKIFDMSEKLLQYQVVLGKEKISVILHRLYAELCQSTHTATSDDMDHVTALKLLPKYEERKAKEYTKMFTVILDTYLGFFLANYSKIIDKMHRINSDILYEVLPKNIIKDIAQIKTGSVY